MFGLSTFAGSPIAAVGRFGEAINRIEQLESKIAVLEAR
tara:strand:+ start:196 stop:312 length:117 start_codon:yes stop_codon:yes gene_type:complete